MSKYQTPPISEVILSHLSQLQTPQDYAGLAGGQVAAVSTQQTTEEIELTDRVNTVCHVQTSFTAQCMHLVQSAALLSSVRLSVRLSV